MTRPTAHPLLARLCWLSVAVGSLLFGPALLDCVAKPFVVHRAPEAAPADPYPSGYDTWIAEAELTAKYHGIRWANGAYTTDINEKVAYGQYEPWYFYRRLADHLGGDIDLETYAIAAGDTWRDSYSINNSGAVLGYYNYTDGLRLDWTQNADTTSRDALLDQAVSAAYTGSGGETPANMKDESLNREVAYAALGYINSEVYCGATHNTRLPKYIDMMLGDPGDTVTIGANSTTMTDGGHIEQWLGSITTDSDGNVTGGTHNFDTTGDVGEGHGPFMAAITGWTAIQYYENAASINGGITPDVRVVPKLVRIFDAMWPYYWVEADASMKYRYNSTDGAPALNNMMAVIYWWLYKETGDIRHLTRGDLLFNGTNGYESLVARPEVAEPPLYNVKEFNELTRWTIDGLEWRAEGVALWQ